MANLLEVKGLTTRVSGFTILNNLDFSIEENELRVLLGPNGAGKTTLICMITGQFKPVAGSIHFAGRDITGWAPDDIFQAGISRKFQVPEHVRDPLGLRQHHGLAAGPAPSVLHAVSEAERRRSGIASGRFSNSSSWRTRPATLPTRSVAWRTAMARTRHADCV